MGRRHRTEAEVLRQARRLFISKGYAGASVRRIADAAGVSVGTVASMGGKDALFLRCMEELANSLPFDSDLAEWCMDTSELMSHDRLALITENQVWRTRLIFCDYNIEDS